MPRNAVEYTDVDLNTDATTEIFSPSHNEQAVERVEMPNGGSTAEVALEVTDGTTTYTLASSGSGGDAVSFAGTLPLTDGETLQINVTTVEGSAQTDTAGVFVGG